ncbi:hypothetical protein MTR67_040527 [Solanum verrucosum]|uniref:S-protein homolog n=1 Tax=Solanum verrucosum TaxID=315347 RepID=A0AAF0UJE9_SOLVR|nr:hypothetical protein MTR67_040527 [Solanum verrucosum]
MMIWDIKLLTQMKNLVFTLVYKFSIVHYFSVIFIGIIKTLTFDVFNKHIIKHCKGTDGDIECHWKVQEDGFYFASCRTDEYVKKYDW